MEKLPQHCSEDDIMAITTLLAVHSVDEPVENIKPIIELSGDLGAHLNLVVFGIMKSMPTAMYGGLPDFYLSEMHDRAVSETNHRAALVEEMLQDTYLSASVLAEYLDKGMIASTMSRHALYCDMVVIPNGVVPETEASTDAFNGILFESGRPVLIMGAGEKSPLPIKRVIMAWNCEPEAAKAIHQSLPLLKAAQEVHLVLVDPDGNASEPNPGDDMAAFLTRHSLKVTVDRVPSVGKDVSNVLLQHATDKDADLIVMGGYGHSRLREWLLGGTTRDLLSKSELPVLMSH